MTCKNEQVNNLSEIFKALSHPIRLQIVMGLMTKDNCNVNTMVEKLGVAQSSISQHLSILKNAGIVEGYRKGNQICYKLENKKVKRIINAIGD